MCALRTIREPIKDHAGELVFSCHVLSHAGTVHVHEGPQPLAPRLCSCIEQLRPGLRAEQGDHEVIHRSERTACLLESRRKDEDADRARA